MATTKLTADKCQLEDSASFIQFMRGTANHYREWLAHPRHLGFIEELRDGPLRCVMVPCDGSDAAIFSIPCKRRTLHGAEVWKVQHVRGGFAFFAVVDLGSHPALGLHATHANSFLGHVSQRVMLRVP